MRHLGKIVDIIEKHVVELSRIRMSTTSGYVDTAGAVPAATAGTVLFLSPTTAGALTATEPTTAGQISKPLAIIQDNDDTMVFFNWRGALISDVELPTQTYITVKMGTEADGDDNRTFSLTTGSFAQGKYLSVYKNGQLQEESATADYVTSGTTIAYFNAVVLDTDKITLVVRSYTVENMQDPMTTAGDIIYRNSTVPARLPVGTSGQILQVNSGATAPQWTTPDVVSYDTSEDIAANLSVSIIQPNPETQKLLVDATTSDFGIRFANSAYDLKVGQTFLSGTGWKLNKIKVKIKKAGTPTGDVRVSIYATVNSGAPYYYLPTGSELAYGLIPYADVTTTLAVYTANLNTVLSLSNNTQYAVVLTRTDDVASSTDYYFASYTDTSVYASGNEVSYHSSEPYWISAPGTDVYIDLYDASTKLVKTRTNTVGSYEKVLGFSTTSTTSGSNAIVQTKGVLNGFTGLTPGAEYYAQDTAGTIGTTKGTNTRKVGVAISATQLLIDEYIEDVANMVLSTLSATDKYVGVTQAGVAGATLAFGDLVYFQAADSRWELADANLSAGYDKKLGMCVLAAAGDGSATNILLTGNIRADSAFPTMTIGSAMYMSETAGDIVVAQPTTADACIRVVGFANTADELYFNPSSDYIIHA